MRVVSGEYFQPLRLVLFSTVILGWLLFLPDEYETLFRHVASGSAFVSNFTLLSETGYFDKSTDLKPLAHLWSLGIEEQFYILWPAAPVTLFGMKMIAAPSISSQNRETGRKNASSA